MHSQGPKCYSLKYLYKIATVFVMVIMLISVMRNTVLYAVYEYNKAFFIDLFCVNKNRPQLQCNGHCKLAQMQREETEQKASEMLKQLQFETVVFCSVRIVSIETQLPFDKKYNYSLYRSPLYSFLYTTAVVKPPESSLSIQA